MEAADPDVQVDPNEVVAGETAMRHDLDQHWVMYPVQQHMYQAYVPPPPPPPQPPVMNFAECPRCFGLVRYDTQAKHRSWHEALGH